MWDTCFSMFCRVSLFVPVTAIMYNNKPSKLMHPIMTAHFLNALHWWCHFRAGHLGLLLFAKENHCVIRQFLGPLHGVLYHILLWIKYFKPNSGYFCCDPDGVTDGQVVRAGVSVTWNVLSWPGRHEIEPWLGRIWGAWHFCPKSYLNQYICIFIIIYFSLPVYQSFNEGV